jgi:hypothetical protein
MNLEQLDPQKNPLPWHIRYRTDWGPNQYQVVDSEGETFAIISCCGDEERWKFWGKLRDLHPGQRIREFETMHRITPWIFERLNALYPTLGTQERKDDFYGKPVEYETDGGNVVHLVPNYYEGKLACVQVYVESFD